MKILKWLFPSYEETHKYCYVCGEIGFWREYVGEYDLRTGVPIVYKEWTCPKGHALLLSTRRVY